MFVYVAAAMAVFPRGRGLLHGAMELPLHSRAGLAAGGVAIVAAAVLGALGVCGWAGVWGTLIILEVIPFLVLAVGVDNMFILVHAMRRQRRDR